MVLQDSELTSYVDEASKRWGVTEVAVSLVDGQSHGYSASPSKQPVDPAETRFRICSNTKLFTAVALGILVDQGKLAWSDKVKDRIPGFHWTDAHTNEHLTVEDLLCHISGRLSTSQNWQFSVNTSHADIVSSRSEQRCYAELYQRFSYDNQTFSLAGHLIHLVSGTLYADFVTEYILKPLGMAKTGFDGRVLLEKGATPTISLDEGASSQVVLPFAAHVDADNAMMAMGGLISTSDDVTVWLAYLQRVLGGSLGPQEPVIITRSTLLEVIRPKTTSTLAITVPCRQGESPFSEFSTPMYASGCERFAIHGIDVISHPGDFPGFACFTLWTPFSDFGLTVLTNTNIRGHAVAMLIALKALERHFGIQEIDWDARLRALSPIYTNKPAPFPSVYSYEGQEKEASISLDKIFGTYNAPGHGTLHLFKPLANETALPRAAVELQHILLKAEPLGPFWTHRREPDFLAVWDADVLFTKFLKVYRIAGNTYACEKFHVFANVSDNKKQIVAHRAMYSGGIVIAHFEVQGDKLTFEMDTTWSENEPLQCKTRGRGDATFFRQIRQTEAIVQRSMVLKSTALRDYTEEKRKKWGIPALSVALHNGGSQGFGRTSNGEITADTVMPIASNTKLFTAVALGILVDEGKLHWDTKICDIIEGFTLSNEHTALFVTVEDLLCHRTGFTRSSMMYSYASDTTSKDILESVQQAPCHNQLRSQYSYDNSGYAIAACIIARLSGQSYGAFVESRILRPLGMSRSGFDSHKAEPYAALPSVTLDDGTTTRELSFYQAEWVADHVWEAPAGLFSTANDLIKWISYLQRSVADTKTAGDPKIISLAGLKELIRPRILGDGQLNFFGKAGVSAFPEFSVGLYGLGICQFQIHGINVACHLGGSIGAASVTLWTPDRDFAMVSLANQGHRGNSVTCMIALRAFEEHFGLPHADWEARMLARDELWKTGPSLLPSEIGNASQPGTLADHQGRYSAPGQPDLFIFDSKTSGRAVPAEISDFWAWKDTVEVLGRPAFESNLIACWSKKSIFERFAKLKHLGGNVYFADWYCCVGGRKGIDGTVMTYSSVMGQKGNLFYLIEKEGKIHLELKKSWEKAIPKVKLGEGEMTLTRRDQ